MTRGQHLYVRGSLGRVPFEHHGIDMGDGTIVHLSPEGGPRLTFRDHTNRFQVRRTTIEQFAEGRPVEIRHHTLALDPEVIAKNAECRIGISGYSLLGGNCEHFATLCATGVASSHQVEMGTATVSAVASAATKAFWVATARTGTRIVVKGAVKGAVKLHPAALLADGIEIATLAVGCRKGLSAPDAKRFARISGNLTALGVGFVLAGPGGAMVSLAAHTSSTSVAQRICTSVSRLFH